MSRRRKGRHTLGDGDEAEPNAVGMSGWLFTDLLLALFVVLAGAITINEAFNDDDNEQVFQEKLQEKDDELDRLEKAKNQKIEILQDRIAELEADIKDLELLIAKLEADIKELEAENARLGERNIEQCWHSVTIEGVPITTEEITPVVANNIKEQIRNELDKPDRIDRKVGLAFLFGAGENPSAGTRLSRVLKSLIEEYDFSEYPEFNESVLRPFWSRSASANEVRMDLHFFTSSNSTNQDGNSANCKTE